MISFFTAAVMWSLWALGYWMGRDNPRQPTAKARRRPVATAQTYREPALPPCPCCGNRHALPPVETESTPISRIARHGSTIPDLSTLKVPDAPPAIVYPARPAPTRNPGPGRKVSQ